MDIKLRSKEIMDCLNNLTDEQFHSLLIEAGLEECPFEDYTVNNAKIIPEGC